MRTLYEEIVTETARMASVPVETIPLSKGLKKRWCSLADYWESKPDIFPEVFYKALMHIAFGRYPRGSREVKPLLLLVEKAILSDATALYAWRKVKSFSLAFQETLSWFLAGDGPVEQVIQRFGSARFYMRTFYREEFCHPLNLATSSRKQRDRAYAVACVKNEYDTFRKIMTMLIPAAATWNDNQWVSKKHIFAAFKAVYGFDYSDNPEDFGYLIKMMKNKLNRVSYCRELFLIKNIPDSMVKVIWPTGLEKDICKQFLAISQTRPLGDRWFCQDGAATTNVVSSWAYQQLCDWRKRKTCTLSDAVRRNLLHFGMGEHPFEIKVKQKKGVILR